MLDELDSFLHFDFAHFDQELEEQRRHQVWTHILVSMCNVWHSVLGFDSE